MTYFHCRHCRRHVLLDHHAASVVCLDCRAIMRPGKGRHTRPASPHHPIREHGRRNRAEDRHEAPK